MSNAPRLGRGGGRGRGAHRGLSTGRPHKNPKGPVVGKVAPTNTFAGTSTPQQPRNATFTGSAPSTNGRMSNNALTRQPTQSLGTGHSGAKSKALYERKYETLKTARERERADAIANGKLADPEKRRRLSEAIVVVGTCEDMCPEFERIQRTAQNDVWAEEADPSTANLDTSQRIPDEARMVKRYKRAAAGEDEQLPSDLRPPRVLRNTCDYLFNEVLGNAFDWSVHPFIWNRTRAIRNDFSIQQVTKPAELCIAIECFERIARFHLLSMHQCAVSDAPEKYDYQQDREQLDRTLVSLIQYYDDSRGRVSLPNEAEFRAYSILFQLQNPDLEDRVQAWPRELMLDQRIRMALKVHAAAGNTEDMHGPMGRQMARYLIAQQHWKRFWDVVGSRSVSYLMACAAEIHFQLVRRIVLNALLTAFRASRTKQMTDWTLDELCKVLNFDDEHDAKDFCEHYGFGFVEGEDGQESIDLNSVGSTRLPAPTKGLRQQIKSDMVEGKRFGRTWPSIINGMNVSQAREVGQVAEEDATVEMDMGDEADDYHSSEVNGNAIQDDGGSLFIPEVERPNNDTANIKPFTNGLTQPSEGVQGTFGAPSGSKAGTGFNFTGPKAGGPVSSSPFGLGQTSGSMKPINPFSITGQTSGMASGFNFLSTANGDNIKADNSAATPSLFDFGAKAASNPLAAKAAHNTSGAFQGEKHSAALNETKADAITELQRGQKNEDLSKDDTPTQHSKSEHNRSVENKPNLALFLGSMGTPPEKSLSTPAVKPSLPTTQQTNPFAEKAGSLDSTWSASTIGDDAESMKTAPSPSGSALFSAQNSVPSPSPANSQPSSALFSFTSTPTAPATQSNYQQDKSPPTTKPAPSFTPQLSQPRKFSISKDDTRRPKTPSGLSKSFGDGSTAAVAPREPSLSDIISRIADEITFDPVTGFLKQYIDFTISNAITNVQEELYSERINAEADSFRQHRLRVRYGRYWRDLCKRRRLERKAREARERRRLGASRNTSRASSVALRQGTVKTTKSRTELVDSLFQSVSTPPPPKMGGLDRQRIGDMESPRAYHDRRLPRSNNRDLSPLKSTGHIDYRGAVSKPQPSSHAQSDVLRRSSFLGFSLSKAPNAADLGRSTTKTNYFRLKALGINPTADSAIARDRKRKRSGSLASDLDSPPNVSKRSSLEISTRSSLLGPSPQLLAEQGFPSVRAAFQTSSKAEKAREEDDALFARLRAARDGLKETTLLLQAGMDKEDDLQRSLRSSQDSNESPSMMKARADARWRASHSGASFLAASQADVPAYRLRESKFVPREQYGRAIEKAREIQESRSREATRPQSRAGNTHLAEANDVPTAVEETLIAQPMPTLVPPAQQSADTFVSQPDFIPTNLFVEPELALDSSRLVASNTTAANALQVPAALNFGEDVFEEQPIVQDIPGHAATAFGHPSTKPSLGFGFPADFDSKPDGPESVWQSQTSPWATANTFATANSQPSFGFSFASQQASTFQSESHTIQPEDHTILPKDHTIEPTQIKESLSRSFGVASQASRVKAKGPTPSTSKPASSKASSAVVEFISDEEEHDRVPDREEVPETQNPPTNGLTQLQATPFEEVPAAFQDEVEQEDLVASYGHANPYELLAEEDEQVADLAPHHWVGEGEESGEEPDRETSLEDRDSDEGYSRNGNTQASNSYQYPGESDGEDDAGDFDSQPDNEDQEDDELEEETDDELDDDDEEEEDDEDDDRGRFGEDMVHADFDHPAQRQLAQKALFQAQSAASSPQSPAVNGNGGAVYGGHTAEAPIELDSD